MELGKENRILDAMSKVTVVFRDKHLLCGLNFPELLACHVVLDNEKANKHTRAKDIADTMEISKPGVSKLLNNMEQKGLIVREHRTEDRKAVFVLLTGKARDILEEQQATARSVTEKVFAEMGKDKANQLIALADAFYESYKKTEATLWEN